MWFDTSSTQHQVGFVPSSGMEIKAHYYNVSIAVEKAHFTAHAQCDGGK